MATNWKFYPQGPSTATATLTVTHGTCATINNCLNPRRKSLIDITALGTYLSGADEFMFKVDVGSAKAYDFVALVQNNLYTDTGKLTVYTDINDNAALPDPQNALNQEDAVSGDELIWFENFDTNRTRRYWWVHLDTISTSAEFGVLLLGAKVEPSVDPNWESPIEIDIESGRIVNGSFGGYNFKTRTHDIKRGWQVKYQFLNDSDVAILDAWLADEDYIDSPFVFTPNGGTNYHYGELLGNPVKTPVQAGLTNYEFTIGEVIA